MLHILLPDTSALSRENLAGARIFDFPEER